MDRDRNEPLKDETAKRPDWRGGDGTTSEAGGGGHHTLPASEEDVAPDEGNRDGRSPLTTIAPPD